MDTIEIERKTFMNILNNWWKCFVMLIKPIPFALGASLFWYYFVYRNGIHFVEGGEVLGIWISMFGVIYGLLSAMVLSTVWNEYKNIGIAVKRHDVDTFIDLRDEEVSPLVHTLMITLSAMIILAFMCIHYETMYSGATFIGTTAYIFALIFYIVLEIDDPCGGIWYIKDIPEEWLQIDIKKFRYEKRRKGDIKTG